MHDQPPPGQSPFDASSFCDLCASKWLFVTGDDGPAVTLTRERLSQVPSFNIAGTNNNLVRVPLVYVLCIDIHSSIHPFIHSSIHASIHPSIHPSIKAWMDASAANLLHEERVHSPIHRNQRSPMPHPHTLTACQAARLYSLYHDQYCVGKSGGKCAGYNHLSGKMCVGAV